MRGSDRARQPSAEPPSDRLACCGEVGDAGEQRAVGFRTGAASPRAPAAATSSAHEARSHQLAHARRRALRPHPVSSTTDDPTIDVPTGSGPATTRRRAAGPGMATHPHPHPHPRVGARNSAHLMRRADTRESVLQAGRTVGRHEASWWRGREGSKGSGLAEGTMWAVFVVVSSWQCGTRSGGCRGDHP
jgi:hypothetical protein